MKPKLVNSVATFLVIVSFVTAASAKGEKKLNSLGTVLQNNDHALLVASSKPITSANTSINKLDSSLNKSCVLHVSDQSVNYFTSEILKYHYNFVYMTLNFTNFDVGETDEVIERYKWVWTFKGKEGAHQYLFLPGDFGYLSLGLLWSHSKLTRSIIYINKTGECTGLKVGEPETDQLIGYALGNLTSQIAAQNDDYNSSYWCYNKRLLLQSGFLYHACKNYVCTYQTFEYSCCKYKINFGSKDRIVSCEKQHYHFGELWWMFPIILGHICFAFYPILLSSIGLKLKSKTNTESGGSAKRHNRSLNTFPSERSELSGTLDSLVDEKEHYICTKTSIPVTFLSTICSPIRSIDFGGRVISRVMRILIILLPMSLTIVRVCLDYIYARNIVKEAVKKGALVGFSSLIAGPDAARKEFLHIFGGPVVALSIYVVFGGILTTFPENLEMFMERGLPDLSSHYLLLVGISCKQKERFSGFSIRRFSGYKRIHNLLVAQIFMLLNWKYWVQAFKLLYFRWARVIFATISENSHTVIAVIVSCIILPVYIIFCCLELIFSNVYFLFPVINCFFLVLKALFVRYFELLRVESSVLKLVRIFFAMPLFVFFCISWYMYCIIFFDGFWFLSKIVMFTYSGIFAYPKLSYGYMVLAFMGVYYLVDSFSAFGESYGELLKLSVEACERVQRHHSVDSDLEDVEVAKILNKRGINRELFYVIIDKHLPRRNQVMITVLKFSCILTVLLVSVKLLVTFDRIQDLSLVSHVFSVLFICALPKIIRVLCARNDRHRNRRKLRQKVQRTILEYLRGKTNITNADDWSEYQLSSSRYESI